MGKMNRVRGHVTVLISVSAFAFTACLARGDRGEPLYPVSGERPAPERVSQLDGYVRTVDDRRVEEGKGFELLPGCHVIGTPAHWGNVSSAGGVLVDTGTLVFAVLMKPGHRYHVDISLKTMGGFSGSAAVEVTEADPSGNQTIVAGPGIRSPSADACRAAESSSSP